MTDRPQSRKKIYQIAKEINISHETLIEYLKKKGHEVKTHMSVVDDAMMHDILSHFKKDKEVAEKHQRKIQTLRETKKKVESKAAAVAEAAKPKTLKKAKPAEPGEVVPVAASQSAPAAATLPEMLHEELAPPALAVAAPEPAELPGAVEVPEPAVEEPKAVGKKAEILARRTPKMGLKIKGKIDLEEVNRSNAVHEGMGPEGEAAGTKEDELKK